VLVRFIGSLAASVALVGCGPADLTVKPITAPSGAAAFAISCEKTEQACQTEAKRLCPKGHRTLEPGKGGGTYLHDWVIACD
jgi:hypothetical protein